MKTKAILGSSMLAATVLLAALAVAPAATAHICSYDDNYPQACTDPEKGCRDDQFHYHFEKGHQTSWDCLSWGPIDVPDAGS